MRHPKIIIVGIALAALTTAGGVTAASAGSSPASPPAASAPATSRSAAAPVTLRTAHVAVAGKTETVLLNAGGLPLYFYRPDTAAKSFVSGGLASLWPPLTSPAPSGTGLSGKLTVLHDAHGPQVAYNGHPLYTFIGDHPGQVTGQGVQDFYVATPALPPITGSAAPAGTTPSAPSSVVSGY